uniref:Putative juvenile hormone acid methyltransferase n=1 Tax=Tabanus bromius TaxID=304241 RepID=A0A0K8TS48_TABBR
MNQPKLYARANSVQRRDAKQILEEFADIIRWRTDKRDSLLDIGCGSGDVTMDYIVPLMPPTFSCVVGSDISDPMIRYANKQFQNSKISFVQMDINSDSETVRKRIPQSFDHVTSFYCLHWVKNLKQAVTNIYNLLKPGGDCLLVFLAKNYIFDLYKQLAVMDKWREYLWDVDKYVGPYQNSENPDMEFTKIMHSTGFTTYNVELRDKLFTYYGVDTMKANVRAVNPFGNRMTEREHEQFLCDYIDIAFRMKLCEKSMNDDDYRFISPYKLIVAYAIK